MGMTQLLSYVMKGKMNDFGTTDEIKHDFKKGKTSAPAEIHYDF
jgi:hypothetical protein